MHWDYVFESLLPSHYIWHSKGAYDWWLDIEDHFQNLKWICHSETQLYIWHATKFLNDIISLGRVVSNFGQIWRGATFDLEIGHHVATPTTIFTYYNSQRWNQWIVFCKSWIWREKLNWIVEGVEKKLESIMWSHLGDCKKRTLVLFCVTRRVLICFLAITFVFWLQITQDL